MPCLHVCGGHARRQQCQVDAAIVCTPNQTLVPISKELLHAGKHFLCEKPICADVASGHLHIECAEDSKWKLLTGHHRCFNRYPVAVKQHILSLGRVIPTSGLWNIYNRLSYFGLPIEWRHLDSARPVFINIIHEIDLLHYWYGPITRFLAEQTIFQRRFDAEEGAAIMLRFASGLAGTFLLSDAVVSQHNFGGGTGENPIIPCTRQDFHSLFGSEGSLSVSDMTRWDYGNGENSRNRELLEIMLEVPDLKIPFASPIELFMKVIKDEESASCDGAEGLRAVVVCKAFKRSMKEHCPVEIDWGGQY
ncbi:uncharacterized protein M421DRAFT_395380 [Didymella exigua CBS 183.55]|uniref:NAD(P)-binding protein n=1 Tax=Didymella exigua CBS 183.55 TaxID=1150837 RepID=A0A6A5S0H8_9PLEO|nr:uncharacterized protein M421DRAFT_395380 [Didymella exigua CBS 183.55]KAF1933363.1 hypothetical protein M421DRAFT_395380 [Didymella exigua CBS 183.55]